MTYIIPIVVLAILLILVIMALVILFAAGGEFGLMPTRIKFSRLVCLF